jgi:hypothetical protein
MYGLNNEKMIENLQLVSYPRSGFHLFFNLLGQQGYVLPGSHVAEKLENRSLFTIARNPVDSVSSFLTLSKFFNFSDGTIREMANGTLFYYIEMYRWLIANADYVISYDDLLNNPAKTMLKFFKKFSIEHKDMEYSVGIEKNDLPNQYIFTSKNKEYYADALNEITLNSKLNEANDLYLKLLSLTGQTGLIGEGNE